MTIEHIARTIAKARYGTDVNWAAMMPAASAIVEELIKEAEDGWNFVAASWLRHILAQPGGEQ